jgi:NADH-ubiquinone oxidoreductase chain 3
MIGAIILTGDKYQEIKTITIKENDLLKKSKIKKSRISTLSIFPFFELLNDESKYSNNIMDSLIYFVLFNIVLGLLLLLINSYFSLNVKYLEKGGGFECGFTSFVQTRERFNVIFYRVSLLFLVFDLEIILAFPYTAVYQKNQSISKNNILAFLYILIVGFIYELKEGALNIIKKVHTSEIE